VNEVERLKDLWAWVEARAESAAAPSGLGRRVRLRRAAVSIVAAMAVVAAGSLSWAAVRWADRTFGGTPERRPLVGPTSPAPSAMGGEDGVAWKSEPVDASVGPGQPDPLLEGQWSPIGDPIFLGGGEAFGGVWRMYAWEAETGFVGWHDVETPEEKHVEAGGTLMTMIPDPCALVPQMAGLEIEDTPDVRRWLLYGYIDPQVASVEVTIAGQRMSATILRVPDEVGSPFDMYVLPVSGVPVTQQSEIALATVIRDAEGKELDRAPLGHCLALGPPHGDQ
jgi:hypothetical protein